MTEQEYFYFEQFRGDTNTARDYDMIEALYQVGAISKLTYHLMLYGHFGAEFLDDLEHLKQGH